MPLESLVLLISQCCVQFDIDIWKIADKHGWTYKDASEFIGCRKKPTVKMLHDLAKELEMREEWLRQILEASENAPS
jgi:hypothetical protein